MDQLPLELAAVLLIGASVPLAVFDIRYHRLPNVFTYSMIVVALAGTLVSAAISGNWRGLALALALNITVTLIGFGLFWFGGLGLGDVKYLASTNQILAFVALELVLLALAIAVISAAVFGLVLAAVKRMRMKDKLAFGPFLVFGYAAALPAVLTA